MKSQRTSGASMHGIIAFRIVKAALLAAVLSFALILAYAFTLQQGWLEEDSIAIVNTVIKVVGSVFAAFIATIKCDKRAWLFGGVAGVSYIVLAFVIFSIVADRFALSLALLGDVALGMLAGMVFAMILQLRK